MALPGARLTGLPPQGPDSLSYSPRGQIPRLRSSELGNRIDSEIPKLRSSQGPSQGPVRLSLGFVPFGLCPFVLGLHPFWAPKREVVVRMAYILLRMANPKSYCVWPTLNRSAHGQP